MSFGPGRACNHKVYLDGALKRRKIFGSPMPSQACLLSELVPHMLVSKTLRSMNSPATISRSHPLKLPQHLRQRHRTLSRPSIHTESMLPPNGAQG